MSSVNETKKKYLTEFIHKYMKEIEELKKRELELPIVNDEQIEINCGTVEDIKVKFNIIRDISDYGDDVDTNYEGLSDLALVDKYKTVIEYIQAKRKKHQMSYSELVETSNKLIMLKDRKYDKEDLITCWPQIYQDIFRNLSPCNNHKNVDVVNDINKVMVLTLLEDNDPKSNEVLENYAVYANLCNIL